MTIKDIVKDKTAYFSHFKDGNLYYRVENVAAATTIEFPVPVADLDGALVRAEEKAILLMRHIRRHLAYIEQAKADHLGK